MLKRAIRDLLLLLAVAVAAGFSASLFELRHGTDGGPIGSPPWQPQELTAVALALAGGLAWFGSRRWADQREEPTSRTRQGTQPQEPQAESVQGTVDPGPEPAYPEATWRLVLETVPDFVATLDRHGKIRLANRPIANVITEGSSIYDFVASDYHRLAKGTIERVLQTGEIAAFDASGIGPDGSAAWYTSRVGPVRRGDEIVGVTISSTDITKHRQLDRQSRERSGRDPLTGALSHGAVIEALRERLSANPGALCAVAMVDVDGIKATNHTYGYEIGDAVLITVARALAGAGAVVGRYSGDEFVSLLPGADRDKAEGYRDTVLASLATSAVYHPASDTQVPVSVSVGLAVYPSEAERPEDLIRLADSALYASRRQEPAASPPDAPHRLLDKERAARLVAEIVPLLTRPGSREDKLRLVAHHLSVGAGYDAVNFEVAGERPEVPQTWERAFARAPKELVDAWMQVQGQSDDHPLSQLLERTRRPVFLDQVEHDDRLTDAERGLLAVAGLRSALVVPMIWQDRLVGMLSVCSKKEAAFSSWDAEFLTAIASQVTAIVFMTTLVQELELASASLRQAHSETVMMLAAAAEAYDDTTGRHLQRVRATTEALARDLAYGDEQAQDLGLASVLHDIGKIRVPDSVLKSSEKLTEDEWQLMKQHPTWGGEFLGGRPGFELAELIARSHHERWDGRGYPRGLKEDDIPEAATIVAVADSFDAMTSDRPYRAGRSPTDAVEEIVACSGQQFSPRVVEALVRLHERRALPLMEQYSLHKEAAA